MAEKMEGQVVTRFPSQTCDELKNVAHKLQLPQSVLVRAVVREGLKVIIEHGIRIDDTPNKVEGSRWTNSSDIVNVIGGYTELRPRGRDFVGLCPFHDDHHPSLRVNAEKQVWYCNPCATGGNVITFVMRVEQVGLRQACEILKIEKPSRRRRSPSRAAILLADWLNHQYLLVGARCRELSGEIALAKKIPDPKLSDSLNAAWQILCDLHMDLAEPAKGAELWAARDWVQTITEDIAPEPVEPFPTLTEEYRRRLRSLFDD